MMENSFHISFDNKISEIVLSFPKTMLFFQHFGILPPYQEKTMEEICREQDIRYEFLESLLKLYLKKEFITSENLVLGDLPNIIFYLQNSHRYYLEEIYPAIKRSVEQLNKVNNAPGAKMVEKFFEDYFDEVEEHLDYENRTVFPYIKNMYNKLILKNIDEKSGIISISEYREHHNDIEEKLDDLMHLLIKYLPVQKDKYIRRKLYMQLAEVNYDLSVHSKIEELIVMPLVEKMEKKLKAK